MNKQYRPLEAGEVIQEGDEYFAGYKWDLCTSAIGVKVGYFGKYRRPISLSTDTEALDSKMAGLTDYPWHLCPLGWWGAGTLKSGQRYFSEREVAEAGEVLVIDNSGTSEDWQNSATPIPEREKVLNKLAHIAEWKNVPVADTYKYDIDFSQWHERRKQRIEAGLISLPTTITDAVADAPSEWKDEDDLTWLAKNLDEWKPNQAYSVKCADGKALFISRKSAACDAASNYYTHDQWLQRRRELGLESNCSEIPNSSEQIEPDWDSAPEGATHRRETGCWYRLDHGEVCIWKKSGGWYLSRFDADFLSGSGEFVKLPEQSKSTESVSDLELPGMWERADYEGGLDESRGPNWKPEPQEQEGNGEGLPPVGWHGEAEKYGTYVSGQIVYHRNDGESALFVEDGEMFAFWSDKFLPTIKSTAERKRDELIAEIEEKDVIDGSDEEVTIAIRVVDYLIKSGEVKE